jgi:rhomboid protease GluP
LLVAVAFSPVRRQAEDWSLVLTVEQIPHELRGSDRGFQLFVDEADAERSALVLSSFEQESRVRRSAPRAPRIQYGPTVAGFVLAAALPLFAMVIDAHAAVWMARGSADSTVLLGGQLWRALTALTLHVDAPHVLGNALSCGVFGTLLFRALGPGLGSALMLAAGAGGNWLNAWLRGPGHDSVGASTALFGALGVLVGLQFAERWRYRFDRRRAWLPLGAGLALLAMLGTAGERTDIPAHLLGLVVGIPLGAIAGFGLRAPPRPLVQYALCAASLAALAGAWLLAFRA